ncbi:IclR family transcriptional regulator [Shewanella sp. D64]|uniref:IclR family transcriptional regulator n=1 Tax=unclassified Shewanella TaxID=196818 RepID=UPI0022BA3BAD|nr:MULTISPECIES: IclR family transcriptional regulator [unclassified Shewanella]MEC4723965.1 IclR family transcriptional regulator [Shewanella sp. D64]MEC4735985.1 IclR family transcriptional regulator [Shewanella sp. E94]WBJ93052.1 IclR family transcriptional regulator [Shewanella sp. MTB7]
MEISKKREYSAPALEKGFEILELLAEEQKPMSLAQISTTLKRSKSELFRMLAALEKMGYLAKNEGSDFFHITNRLFDLGLRVPPNGTLVEVAYPIMRELSAEILQSCHIAVESQNRMVVIAKLDNPSSVGFSVHLGHHLFLNESGSGHVLLAWKSEKSLNKSIEDLRALDNKFDEEQLLASLEEIRAQGFARIKSPIIQSLEDISFPIFLGGTKSVIATITVPFLKGNKQSPSISEAKVLIKSAAEKLSSISLSYSGQL